MKLTKAFALTCALLTASSAMAADDELYLLPTQSVAMICTGGGEGIMPKDKFDDFFAQAIPTLQEVKDEGGLVAARYMTDIRAGVVLIFKDSSDHTAHENADRVTERIGQLFKDAGFEVDMEKGCNRYEIGGQMM